jgi:hypothetical protein
MLRLEFFKKLKRQMKRNLNDAWGYGLILATTVKEHSTKLQNQ